MNSDIAQVLFPVAVTLMVVVAGITSTCVAVKSAEKCEMQKVIILRFVNMFETAIQIDFRHFQCLFGIISDVNTYGIIFQTKGRF